MIAIDSANVALVQTDVFTLVGEEMIISGRIVTIDRVIRDPFGWVAEGTDADGATRLVYLKDPMSVMVLA